jgi:predicted O-methyltransferase YrrM
LLLERNPVLREMFATGVTPGERGHLRPLNPTAIEQEEAEVLYRVVLEERPAVCVEIGFAYGVSALAILTALVEAEGQLHLLARAGAAAGLGLRPDRRLISIDPNQKKSFGNAGLEAVRRAGLGGRHELIEKESQLALPALVDSGLEIGLGYIDGWHTFDGTLLDFWFLDRLLRPNGIVAFNDCNLPAVDRVIGFVHTHRRYAELDVREFLPPQVRRFSDRYFRKIEDWNPEWNFYEPF